MERTIFTLLVIVFLFTIPSWISAQEEPEPTIPPPTSYEVEIAWGPRVSGLVWAAANVVSVNVVAGDVDIHSYMWTILGQVTWEFRPIDFDDANPTKVEVVLDVDTMGGPFRYWGFYRVRVRGIVDLPDPELDIQGAYVESWWVPVIDLSFPGIPSRP